MALHILIAEIRQKHSGSDKYYLAEIRGQCDLKRTLEFSSSLNTCVQVLFQASIFTSSDVLRLLSRGLSRVPSPCITLPYIDHPRGEQGVLHVSQCFEWHLWTSHRKMFRKSAVRRKVWDNTRHGCHALNTFKFSWLFCSTSLLSVFLVPQRSRVMVGEVNLHLRACQIESLD